ncbi:MAG: polysaccharide lyase family 7 protein [Thermoguttaceae bacterium]|nr:polysaccharide lyase family 7 protein [Thermoguttaceae bacterium]MDW8077975.1 polysaccharide lyase family 7 protein [Thermoguttaceae bacterium]
MTELLTLVALLAWPSLSLENDHGILPAELFDFSRWKLTLPVDTDRPGSPDEVTPSQLRTFVDGQFFFVDEDRKGVVFRAPCGGKPTRGSRYPRCELREMADAQKLAAWSTTAGRHALSATLAIRKTPPVKRHVVCAQIHDDRDDVLMIRLEDRKLLIEREDEPDVVLEPNYRLGTPFELRMEAGQGRIRVWYEGKLKLDWSARRKGCYFKVGCYPQSNPTEGDPPDSVAEVVLYKLELVHEP